MWTKLTLLQKDRRKRGKKKIKKLKGFVFVKQFRQELGLLRANHCSYEYGLKTKFFWLTKYNILK